MDFNRFTQKSQEALSDAQSRAVRRGHTEVEPEHLLLSLLEQADGIVSRLFKKLNISEENFKADVERVLDKRPSVSGPGVDPSKILVSQRLGKILVQAEDEAKRMQDEYISVEHLFLGILDEGAHGPLSKIYSLFGLTRNRVLAALTELRGNQRVTSQNPEETYEALQRYGRDLVQEALKNKLDPVIG
ncbi:MAG: type VI secretion system ATPase TssH, partial [SAR324 cluster bacterium]|nr:type VI secretion system ATPase TssH [SAR324 cluster bacterium]